MYSQRSILTSSLRHICYAMLLLVVGILLSAAVALAGTGEHMHQEKAPKSEMISRAEVLKLMEYEKFHDLTPEQEALRVAGLENIKAPCCAEYSAATCCCPCNLAKALWGFTKKMILEDQATAGQIQVEAEAWLANISVEEFTGDACFDGGCGRSMRHNGCGGMQEEDVRI